jgi:hypothetical protein
MGKALSGTALGLGIIALVLGLVWSLTSALVPALVLFWIFSIAAIVISIIAMLKSKAPEEGRGMAIAGLILSIIAAVLALLTLSGFMAYFGVLSPAEGIARSAPTRQQLPEPSAAQVPQAAAQPAVSGFTTCNENDIKSAKLPSCGALPCKFIIAPPFSGGVYWLDSQGLGIQFSNTQTRPMEITALAINTTDASAIQCRKEQSGVWQLDPGQSACIRMACTGASGQKLKGDLFVTYYSIFPDGKSPLPKTAAGNIYVTAE